jgi:uncharacterized damage-inducible protein DinB
LRSAYAAGWVSSLRESGVPPPSAAPRPRGPRAAGRRASLPTEAQACLPEVPPAHDNQGVSRIERPLPPLNADERATLEGWLDFHRATLAMKCEGLNDEQAVAASVPPSTFTLTGLVQHMAEVERNWFRRVLAGEQAPPIYDPQADPDGPDGGFELAEGATLRDALATWRAEISRARGHCAERPLVSTGRFMGQDVSLRWIYVHMIEEYARHNGHADLLRERIDGTTGV